VDRQADRTGATLGRPTRSKRIVRATAIMVLLASGAGTARAEDHADASVRESSALTDEPDGPWLDLDVLLPPSIESFDATRDGTSTTFERWSTRMRLEGTWWTAGADVPENGATNLDLPGEGWRAAVRLSRALGPVRFTADASLNHIDSRYGRGWYRDLSISIGRTKRLSRWMTGWISLSLGHRAWLGEERPDGEQDATQIMLSIGTTFR